MPFDKSRYIKRLKLNSFNGTSSAALSRCLNHHIQNVPIENISTRYSDEKIPLDIHKLFDQIIDKERGGLPIQLNYLLYHLFFDELNATLHLTDKHVVSFINIGNASYLVDAGTPFGPNSLIEIRPGKLQLSRNRYFRVEQNVDEFITLQRSTDAISFETCYKISLKSIKPIELISRYDAEMSKQKDLKLADLFAFRYHKEGFASIASGALIQESSGRRSTEKILNEYDLLSKARQHFNIASNLSQ